MNSVVESVPAEMESERFQDNVLPIEDLIGGGVSGVIYALDEDTVLKTATGLNFSVHDLEVERRIYERLSCHPCILRCIRVETRGLVLERLVCPLRKRLRDLRRKGEVPSDETLMKWAGQIIDGLGYIHSKDVLQADIRCHNLLLDENDDLKLCDFGGSSIDGEGATVCYERRSRHPTIQGPSIATEIFALGTTLYEMSTAEPPYPKINSATGEIQKLYAAGEFPSVEHLMLGRIIKKCWRGSYESAAEAAFDLRQV